MLLILPTGDNEGMPLNDTQTEFSKLFQLYLSMADNQKIHPGFVKRKKNN